MLKSFLPFLLAITLALPALAQSVSKGCDVDFYNQLHASAELKGAREMEAAQAIILKPDSVLEYSCFLKQLNYVRESITFQEDMGQSMTAAVGGPVSSYLGNNFNHRLDGGLVPRPSASTSDMCKTMGIVWDTAKCFDFDPNLFTDFATPGADLRSFPQICPNRNGIAGLMLDAKVPAGGRGAGDQFVSHQKKMTDCGHAVPTGVKTIINGDEVDEMVCLAPGCFYNGRSCVANP